MTKCNSLVYLIVVILLSAGLAVAQTYTVGVARNPPFGGTDPETGEATGYAAEVVRAIAQDAGLDLEIVPTGGLLTLAPLLEGDIDVAVGPITITDERKEMGVAFTDVYARWHDVLVVPADADVTYTSLDDLAGEAITSPGGGSIYYAYLLERSDLFHEILPGTRDESIEHLRSGTAAAYYTASFAIEYLQSLGDLADMKIVETYEPAINSGGGIAVRQADTELLEQINASLNRLIADGTIAAIAEKWGLTPP